MIWKIILSWLALITWISIWFVVSNFVYNTKHFIKLSQLADIKTIQYKKDFFNVSTRTYCVGDCRDYVSYSSSSHSSYSSRWWSSYGWGK